MSGWWWFERERVKWVCSKKGRRKRRIVGGFGLALIPSIVWLAVCMNLPIYLSDWLASGSRWFDSCSCLANFRATAPICLVPEDNDLSMQEQLSEEGFNNYLIIEPFKNRARAVENNELLNGRRASNRPFIGHELIYPGLS